MSSDFFSSYAQTFGRNYFETLSREMEVDTEFL